MDYVKVHEAIKFAAFAHDGQHRKFPGNIPFLSHPCEVMTILAKAQCSEDVIIAGVLHDVVEDTQHSLDEIRQKFGDRVANIVSEVTEDKSLPSPERKESYLKIVEAGSDEAKLVSAADLLANIASMIGPLREGQNPWPDFSKDPARISKIFLERYDRRIKIVATANPPFLEELKEANTELKELTTQIYP